MCHNRNISRVLLSITSTLGYCKMNTELLQIPEQYTSQQTTESQEEIVEEDQGTVCAADKQCVSSDTSEPMMSQRSCSSAFQRRTKRTKMDPVEVDFEQINTTLGKMANTFCVEGGKSCGEDPDVLIGKLVTAELKKGTGSRKEKLKKKFMQILYGNNE